MQALAAFIMRGRMQAVLVAVVFALLPMWSPLLGVLSYLSGAALGLVTLRRGYREGLWVFVSAALITALVSMLAVNSFLPAAAYALLIWLPVMLLAVILRATVSMSRALVATLLLAFVIVLGMFLAVDDPAAWWRQSLLEGLKPLLQKAGLEGEDSVQEVLVAASQLMTGVMAVGLALNALMCLFLARWWQAQLYNPGGFRTEFYSLRLDAGIAILTAVTSLVALSTGNSLATNLLVVLLVMYMVQGMAVVHAVVAAKAMNIAWLVVLYILMLFLPQLMLLVGVAGFVDTWLDFRARVTPSTPAK